MQKPNIIWITLDSVRQDHTSLDGYRRDTTPHLAEIADKPAGISYSRCFSHASVTATSAPSILSGTYPSRHGTYYEGRHTFPDDLPTVAELLSAEGYHTACLSNNTYAGPVTNLDRGFKEHTILGSTLHGIWNSAGPKALLKYLLNLRRHSVGFETDLQAHSGAYLMNEITSRWLKKFSNRHEPFFLYLHYNETHRAYYPPLPYLDRFTDEIEMSPREAAEFSMYVHHNLIEIVANGANLTEDELEALIAMYDSELAYTDERIGELFKLVREILGETIFIVTADHGELFGENDRLGHKYNMHNGLLNVPMVIYGLDGLAEETLVQHSDVMATILELVGADTESLQGVDLRNDTREYAISQAKPTTLDPLLEYNPDFDTSSYCTEGYSVIQDEKFKYYQYPDTPELFELPDETTDVSDQEQAVAAELDEYLTEWLQTEGVRAGEGETVELDDEAKSRLSDLGYLSHEM